MHEGCGDGGEAKSILRVVLKSTVQKTMRDLSYRDRKGGRKEQWAVAVVRLQINRRIRVQNSRDVVTGRLVGVSTEARAAMT